jgi:hypothetical protein
MDTGYFVESRRASTLFMKRVVGGWMNRSCCLYLEGIGRSISRAGPVGTETGTLGRCDETPQRQLQRKAWHPSKSRMKPLKKLKIFDVTGGTERFAKIENIQ